MDIYTIYKVTNIVNNKVYIGFDSRWPQRQKDHKKVSFNSNSKDYNLYFHRAIRKYGKENFIWEIIYQSKDGYHTLNIMEPYFIKEYDSFSKNGYNLSNGGRGTLGFKHSDETKENWSKTRKGSIPWNKGKTYNRTPNTEEHNQNLRKPKSVPRSEEHNKNQSLVRKNVPWTQARWDAQHKKYPK